MRLININAFLEREELIKTKRRMDRQTRVLEFCDDEATKYAILSHRWTEQEVTYDEMIDFAKMGVEERDEIRGRRGYKKILDSCSQAKRDGYEWLWVDTCCIDKRSSAELSEAINSMYRWYEHSGVCYAYLHDVLGSFFPTESNVGWYLRSRGWPEWFSRGWTLQEMIAPRNLQFFNEDWQPIGSKRTLAPTLAKITRVPQHVLINGLTSNRPCVAQIMSWAADRNTTRVEDRAYSLLGLLDVNMPMLYGEGKRAFQRLQLEIIRTSNDQSIFAWGSNGGNNQTRSVLADDPSFFRDCNEMELMDFDEFLESLKEYIPEQELPLIEEDRFGVFPITNRGIHIWLLLYPLDGFSSVFKASLPCRFGPLGPPVTITLNLWKSNYYRYSRSLSNGFPSTQNLQFYQLYLSHQDALHRDITFEIDDSAVTQSGLTYCGTYPWEPRQNTLTLTGNKSLCVRVYADTQTNSRFIVGFGHCFGQYWIHLIGEEYASTTQHSWKDYAKEEYQKMRVNGPEYAQSLVNIDIGVRREPRSCVCSMQTPLPGSSWIVRISCIMWDRSRNYGVRIDAFQNSGFGNVSKKWRSIDVDRNNGSNHDMQGLMIPSAWGRHRLPVDGISREFSLAPKQIKLGDYGHLIGVEDFHCEGNIVDDLKPFLLKSDITPRKHKIGFNTSSDYVTICEGIHPGPPSLILYKPFGLSLPSNCRFNSLLASYSTRLTNRYLVTTVVECCTVPPGERSKQSGCLVGFEGRRKSVHPTISYIYA
ncbi:heterokaryon incompatibility protein-domain-containing protein [Scleroderma yunnanense]